MTADITSRAACKLGLVTFVSMPTDKGPLAGGGVDMVRGLTGSEVTASSGLDRCCKP